VDNVRILVGNNEIFSDTIFNFDTNKAINDVGAAASYATPERRIATRAL
jgi:hypothetical protein